jgi:hemoglobin
MKEYTAGAAEPNAASGDSHEKPRAKRANLLLMSEFDAPDPTTIFQRVGAEFFGRLAEQLYRRIDGDPRIRAMFPADLSSQSDSVRDMTEFLTQFFGGPAHYSARKGHPRLRARHMRFAIDSSARDAWLANALAALDDVCMAHPIDKGTRDEIRAYLERASAFMVNQPG